MTRRFAKPFSVLAFLLFLLPQGIPAQSPSPSPLQPASTGGVATVDRALAQLSTHRRLLVVGAHPDDEDTSLIALVARGMGGESAYLSLSRGEGGQNLIGPELGVGLGLIRSRELLAARSVDGGRQFFTRAYDFGYTRSLDETLRLWPKDVLVEDAVRVIRRFKPQVIVSVFPGVPHRNHGQHQAAGATAYAAFPVAGDPDALPQLQAEGLSLWTPQALYRSTRFEQDPTTTTLTLPLNGVDPLAGKSIFQLAMASRSLHRSQDMGQIQRLGPQESRVGWVDGIAGKEGKDLFDGIDTRLSALAATVADAGRRKAAEDRLAAAQAAAERARANLAPGRLGDTVPAFLEILRGLRDARAALASEDRPASELIGEKIEVAEAGLAAAAGIAVDATTAREEVVNGETFTVQATLWNSGTRPVSGASVTLEPAPEWGGEPLAGEKTGEAKELAAGALGTWEVKPTVPATAPATIPYFLRKPLAGGLYDWSAATPAERGEPFGPPPLTARFRFTIEGVPVELEREVVHLHRDQAIGEVRQPLRVVPAVEVAVADELLVWPVQSREPRRLHVTLTSHSATPVSGRLEVSGWPSVSPQTFNLAAAGETADLELTLAPPRDFKPGRTPLEIAAVTADGQRFSLAVPEVDYPHIRATPRPVPARVAVQATDLRLPPLKRVGYVRGASDRVPEFLRQAGVPLEMLGPEQLEAGDLSRYDAIVIGSRAYETDPVLARANHRILDYAKNGGLVIVQYQQYPFIEGKFAPFPLEIARPHDRITDETAPVTVLDPAHPVFNTPNKIGPEDWEGWIQERGLYFARTWDPAYTPLLSMKDPDTEDLKGGLLVAKLGKGTYVYTGLAFFRQIPAGVPGGYRLFANLLGLK